MINLSQIDMSAGKVGIADQISATLSSKKIEIVESTYGCFGQVIVTNNFAIKVNNKGDWCNAYYRLAARIENIHAPKIHCLIEGKDETITIMERLYENNLNYDHMCKLRKILETTGFTAWKDSNPYDDSVPTILGIWIETVRLEALNLRYENTADDINSFSHPAPDAHFKNWMQRENGTLVLTDPWS